MKLEPRFIVALGEAPMRDIRNRWKPGVVALTLVAALPWLGRAQDLTRQQTVLLHVLVPADAQVEVEGELTKSTGADRLFISPPLEPGKHYVYTLKVIYVLNGERKSREERVSVTPGQEKLIDLRSLTAQAGPAPAPKLDVPFVPTPQNVVDKMLELADVKKGDVLYDLGCGDGRIVVTAAKKYGCKGVGIDIDPARVKDSNENAKKEGVEDKVEFRQGNVFQKIDDIDKASVVTLYLFPHLNLKLRPTLQKTLKPGSRIVSHDFDMGDWKPVKQAKLKDSYGRDHSVYLWIVGAGEKPKAKPKKEENEEAKKPERPLDVHFVPTPQKVVDKMLELAEVKRGDVVYDLGCGDGRIVVTAAKKYGVKAAGFDLDPARIKDSKNNVAKNGVGDLVTIEKKDVFKLDLTKATVVTLYLLPELNVKLIPQLEKLPAGSRIVSHDFDMKGVKPKKHITLKATDEDGVESEHDIYLWVTPLEKEKND
jgi:uncharacterized protein (TIGR03000 family)